MSPGNRLCSIDKNFRSLRRAYAFPPFVYVRVEGDHSLQHMRWVSFALRIHSFLAIHFIHRFDTPRNKIHCIRVGEHIATCAQNSITIWVWHRVDAASAAEKVQAQFKKKNLLQVESTYECRLLHDGYEGAGVVQCVYHRSFGFARDDRRHRMVYYIENNTSIQIGRHAIGTRRRG